MNLFVSIIQFGLVLDSYGLVGLQQRGVLNQFSHVVGVLVYRLVAVNTAWRGQRIGADLVFQSGVETHCPLKLSLK